MALSTSFRIVLRAVRQFSADGVSQMGAALAYYALFSTAPLLILAVMVAGILFGEEDARDRVGEHLTEVVGPASAREILIWMEQAVRPTTGGWAAALGIAALVVGALGAFLHVRRCLCIIWRLEPPHGSGFFGTLLDYVLALLMVFSVGLLLLLSLATSTALLLLGQYLEAELPGSGMYLRWLQFGLSFTLMSLFFGLIFRVMSGRHIAWGYIVYGALITALLFTIGKTLISLYVAHLITASVYGAAASLVVFLIWVYYSAQIFFFGAELVQARRTRDQR